MRLFDETKIRDEPTFERISMSAWPMAWLEVIDTIVPATSGICYC
jgi:hypothetical protein